MRPEDQNALKIKCFQNIHITVDLKVVFEQTETLNSFTVGSLK